MPEAVEVRVIAEELDAGIKGLILETLTINPIFKSVGIDSITLPSKVRKVTSYGKKLIIKLKDGCIVVSLGMSGKFQYHATKHNHMIFKFQDLVLYYNDTRRIGSSVIFTTDFEKYIEDYGVAILDYRLDKKEWRKYLTPKLGKRKICHILTDQHVLAGVGHYLQTDTLYLAGVSPLRLGNTITKKELERIRLALYEVLDASYKANGFTLMDYLTPSGRKGVYSPVIYGRKVDNLGNKVTRIKLGGRTIHYVKKIQV